MKNETKSQIISELEDYLSLHKMSANAFATKSGVNASVISALRSGKTSISAGAGKDVEIANKYYEMIATAIGKNLTNNYWEVVPTDQMKRILATLEDAKEYGYTNVVIGETGCGKTFVCNLFAKSNPVDLMVITVGSSDNIGDLLDKLIDALKIGSEKSKGKKIRAIVNKLRDLKFNGLKPMIIFDEAEYMKQPALCAMKELYDHLNGICSIVLMGTDQLIRNIDKLRKKNKEGIPQFYRRIKFGIRYLPAIDKTFKQFLNGLNDSNLVNFLRENCDNYGELHDVLVPAMREADRTGESLTEKFVRTIINLPKL
jgi:DNA transposition AAA+ family ATPase